MLSYVQQVCARVSQLQAHGDASAACELMLSLLVVLRAQGCQGLQDEQEAGTVSRQVLGEMAVLLAIDLLQRGVTNTADKLLSMLGFRYRLAASAFNQPQTTAQAPGMRSQPEVERHLASLQQPQQPPEAPHPQGGSRAVAARALSMPPLVLDAAMDPSLLAALQTGFRPAGAFWHEHGYWGDSCGFFSYVYPLSGAPQHPVEAAILQLHHRLLLLGGSGEGGAGAVAPGATAGAEEAARRARRATHAEWWVHCRDPGAPHQLHFDVDETQLRHGRADYALRHPLLGSLLFLEGNPACHGATLVLDQTPGHEGLARRGWLVRPATGRYAFFRGDLLHGVMPGAPSKPAEGGQPRITLMVAWWELDPLQQRQLAEQGSQQAQRENSGLPAGAEMQQQRQRQGQGRGQRDTPANDAVATAREEAQQTRHVEGEASGSVAPGREGLGTAAAGPMQLPPWRRDLWATGGAMCTWPSDFASGGREDAGGKDGEDASGTNASAAAMGGGLEAVSLLQPAWERVGSSKTASGAAAASEAEMCPSSSDSDGSAGSESEEDDAAGHREGRAATAKRSRLGGEELARCQHAAHLQLLYPPLRFFLFDAHDIRAAYVPE